MDSETGITTPVLRKNGGLKHAATNYGATKSETDFIEDCCQSQDHHGRIQVDRSSLVETDGTKPATKITRFLWVLPLIHCEFWIAAGFSLLQSFYPPMASRRGLQAEQYSYVYSTYKIAMMFGAMLAERLMVWCSPVTCYLLGLTGCVIFNIIFGSLCWMPAGSVLGLSIAFSLLGGVSNSLYIVSAYAVFTNRFVSNTGIAIATLECMFTSGNTVGSILGGTLIDKYGYPVPFFVIAVIIAVAAPAIAALKSVLNTDGGTYAQTHDEKEVSLNYSSLLWDPMFFAGMGCMVLCWGMLGFNEPTLEPSLREFDLSNTEIGTVYTSQFASSAIGSIIAGAFAHFRKEALFALIGLVLSVLAFLIVGPVPFIHMNRTLTMVYVSQVFTGVGISALYICGLCHMLTVALEQGYPDTVRTTGFVSSAAHTCLFLGGVVMPPVGGYLVETYNYRVATLVVALMLAFWVPVMTAVWISRTFCSYRTRKLNVAIAGEESFLLADSFVNK